MVDGNKKPLIFIVTIVVAIISMALFFYAAATGWFGEAKWGSGAGEFCEAFRPGLIKQPANTWSNLAFIIAALFMAWPLSQGVYNKNSNSLTRNTFYGTFYPCLVVLLGPGSMAMHATGTDLGGFFDMLSMYLVAAFLSSYSLQRYFNLKPSVFMLIFSFVLISCIWADRQTFHIVFDFFGVTVFAFYVGVTVFFEILNTYVRKMNHQSRWGYLSLFAFGLAFFIWNLSLTDARYCNPSSLIQGHGAWHILDAVSLYFLFRYYVSEHKETVTTAL